MEGTYVHVDGRPAVRFERTLGHPVETVWEAVTDPRRLARWFPTEVEFGEDGAMRFSFPGGEMDDMTGEVLALDPPHLFAFLWGEDELRFELEPHDGGCRLRLTHLLNREDEAARTAAGWHVCLDRLAELVDTGESEAPGTQPTAEWRGHYDQYVEAGMPSGAEVP